MRRSILNKVSNPIGLRRTRQHNSCPDRTAAPSKALERRDGVGLVPFDVGNPRVRSSKVQVQEQLHAIRPQLPYPTHGIPTFLPTLATLYIALNTTYPAYLRLTFSLLEEGKGNEREIGEVYSFVLSFISNIAIGHLLEERVQHIAEEEKEKIQQYSRQDIIYCRLGGIKRGK